MIDNWTVHGSTLDVASPITLQAGQKYDLRLEYFDGNGEAQIHLSWSTPTIPWQAIPASQLYLPPAGATTTTTIVYDYDPLYRLKKAAYSDGRSFEYTYDAVGNRLTQTACINAGNCVTTNYTYDTANRLMTVNGVAYTWDANGNLLNDGTNAYAYDTANRLLAAGPVGQTPTSTYIYNGLGDRLSQTVNGVTTSYVLDLDAGLTQVLSDGTNTYLYGYSRIGEKQSDGFLFHLGDALGSVRQLMDNVGNVTLARRFEPFGSVMSSNGSGNSVFAFTGEQFDENTGLTYLRARWYRPETGLFLTRDIWPSDYSRPTTLTRWGYVENNPINRVDPSGHLSKVEHLVADHYIKNYKVGKLQDQNKNFRIRGGARSGSGNDGFADLVDIVYLIAENESEYGVGLAYEIEPEKAEDTAVDEIKWYINVYNNDPYLDPDPRKLVAGTHFSPDWVNVGFNSWGYGLGGEEIWAKQGKDGVIIWKAEYRAKPPIGIPAPYREKKKQQKQEINQEEEEKEKVFAQFCQDMFQRILEPGYFPPLWSPIIGIGP